MGTSVYILKIISKYIKHDGDIVHSFPSGLVNKTQVNPLSFDSGFYG